MRIEREELTVSTSHVKLRVVLFILVLIVAVGAFSYGFAQIGHKDPGYYEITVLPNDEAPMYSVGLELVYYFDGKSNDIKAEMNALKSVYADALMWSYKLLDENRTYPGFTNIASLNEAPGQTMEVGAELASVLADAWERTKAGGNYSVVAGAVSAAWTEILSLDEADEFLTAENLSRIEALAAQTADLSQFSFSREGNAVCFSVSEDYRTFLAAGEYSGTVLSLGILRDAYRLELIRDRLESMGYTQGYLTTDSGITVCLSDHTGASFTMYGFDGTEPQRCASAPAEAGAVSAFVRVFPMSEGELLYHVFGGRFYHPCFSLKAGICTDRVLCADTLRGDGDVVQCVSDAYELLCSGDSAACDSGWALIRADAPGNLETDGAFKPYEGFSVK